MRGWIDLGGDIDWEDYGGKWGKKAKDGSWFVLRFENMWDVCGRDMPEDGNGYICEILRLDLENLPEKEREAALQSSGWKVARVDGKLAVVDIVNGDVVSSNFEMVIVDACISHGVYEPLGSHEGRFRPNNVRAAARREAESLMRDSESLEERLDRPVNKLGTSAREYGRGDIHAPLRRYAEEVSQGRESDDQSKNITLKMFGVKVEDLKPHKVQFSTLTQDGNLVDIRYIKQRDMQKCPHCIMVAEHYREDGSCKCDDPIEQSKMIREWGYKKSDFGGAK